MSFVRSGPRILLVEAKDETLFKNFLITHFEHEEINGRLHSFEKIISIMNHHQTMVYMARNSQSTLEDFEVDRCVILNESAQAFLIKCLNCNASQNIKFVRRAPRLIIVKVLGDIDKTLGDIAEDYKADIEPTKHIISSHTEGTVILLTKGNLNKVIEFSEFYPRALYTSEHFSETINSLDHHALKYINRNTEGADWFSLTITIRDKFEDYKSHYNRMIHVLDALGAGLVLKEGYSEDMSRFFASVNVYKVVLYTYMNPLEIKKILVALEYIENGERIVDFDVYYSKKKIHWGDVKVNGIKSPDKLSEHYRHELYKSLKEDDIQYLRAIEDTIFATR
jgi:hypothetical protein